MTIDFDRSVFEKGTKPVRNPDLDWRPIPGYPNYEISEFGDVWNVQSHRPLKAQEKKRDRYRMVNLSHEGIVKPKRVHSLVASAFLAPSTDPSHDRVLHWDDDPSNNHFTNLRWGSAQDNADDQKRNGTNRAQRVPLTTEMVAEIHASDLSTYDLAEKYGCSHMAIHFTRTGKNHRHLHPVLGKADPVGDPPACDGDGDPL